MAEGIYIYIFQLSGFSNLHRPYTFLLMTDWRKLGHHHPARHPQRKLVPPPYTPPCIVLKGNSRYILCPIDVRPLYKVGVGRLSAPPPPNPTGASRIPPKQSLCEGLSGSYLEVPSSIHRHSFSIHCTL